MTRQEALQKLWQRLFLVLAAMLSLAIGVLAIGGDSRTGVLIFLLGNIGGYVGVHKSLADLKDDEVIQLSASWWAILAPSLVGGILAEILYILFLSNLVAGDIFPKFKPDNTAQEGLGSLMAQHAVDMPAYAKLFFWAFLAGFNQKYEIGRAHV